jgi:hypothetical protein
MVKPRKETEAKTFCYKGSSWKLVEHRPLKEGDFFVTNTYSRCALSNIQATLNRNGSSVGEAYYYPWLLGEHRWVVERLR